MIDIETLATTPEAVILSVGGVKFNPYTNEEPHSFLDFKLDIDEQTANESMMLTMVFTMVGKATHIRDKAFSR